MDRVIDAVDSAKPGSFLHSRSVAGRPGAVDTAWSRAAAKRDDLIRVRRGLYWKGKATRFGVTQPDKLEVALEVAGKGAGPAGWSALAALGVTTQVPAQPSIATLFRRLAGLGVAVAQRVNPTRATLEPLEVAVLEALRPEWSARAEIDVVERVRELAQEDAIRVDVLRAVAEGESGPVRDRLAEAISGEFAAAG